MRTAKLQAQLDAAEHELARVKRYLTAFEEWFHCHGREGMGEVVVAVHERETLRVFVRGMGRASGGVAVVAFDGFRDAPRLLDDLILEWRSDSAPEIRDAAARIARMREEHNRVDAPSCGAQVSA